MPFTFLEAKRFLNLSFWSFCLVAKWYLSEKFLFASLFFCCLSFLVSQRCSGQRSQLSAWSCSPLVAPGFPVWSRARITVSVEFLHTFSLCLCGFLLVSWCWLMNWPLWIVTTCLTPSIRIRFFPSSHTSSCFLAPPIYFLRSFHFVFHSFYLFLLIYALLKLCWEEVEDLYLCPWGSAAPFPVTLSDLYTHVFTGNEPCLCVLCLKFN